MSAQSELKPRAAIIGAGTMGLTLAWLAASEGHSVVLQTGRESVAKRLRRYRSHKDVPLKLPKNVTIVTDTESALACETIILAVPPRAARARLREMAQWVRPEHRIVHSAKGLDDTSTSVSTAITEETCCLRTGLIGGPLVLNSMWKGHATAALVASQYQAVIDDFTALLTSPTLRVYGSRDLIGAELAGAMRTSVGLATGMLIGIGLGRSTVSVLLTRAAVEGSRLAAALGGADDSLSGLNGIGDWFVIAGDKSDELVQAGMRLAAGKDADHEEASSRALALAELARRYRVEMPIVTAVAQVLAGKSVVEAVSDLMSRAARPER